MTVKLLVESGNDFADNSNHGDRAIFEGIVARLRGIWPGCETLDQDGGECRAGAGAGW
ncbi:hypothetical protein ACKWRH_31020 [Bradyrhizobium sp. Pa8]|uniref:hypothetical protein n=1 Tax=Bradyrhizobium sp. Pa8 TaxID=3386552 RepID=UPI00403F412F